MSEALRGRILYANTKTLRNLVKVGKNNPMFGKVVTKIRRTKIRENLTSQIYSEERKLNMSKELGTIIYAYSFDQL